MHTTHTRTLKKLQQDVSGKKLRNARDRKRFSLYFQLPLCSGFYRVPRISFSEHFVQLVTDAHSLTV
eukprot:735412-Amphidinium_carterae.2